MAQASSQHKLDRVRPPRVHITYDVEVGDAIELRSLPFQVAVLGDFTGMPVQPLPRLRDRSFVEVTPDNFDGVVEGMKPHLAFSVENRLAAGAPMLSVDLHFKSLEDFDPANVAAQIRPLRELIDLRVKLSDLLGKLQGNDKLEELLTAAITDPNKLKRLESEIHGPATAAAPVAAPPVNVEPPASPQTPEVETPAAVEAAETASVEAPAEEASAAPAPAEPTEAEPVEAESVESAPPTEALLEAPSEQEQAAPISMGTAPTIDERLEEAKPSEPTAE